MNKPLLTAARSAARFGLIALLGAGSLMAQTATQPTTSTTDAASEEPRKLDKFEVTGSRIKRIDAEGPAPVIRTTRADFDATGFNSVGDALRALPIVSGGSLTSIDGGTSFTPGTNSINLRGLGSNNTLVLINGRRAAPYGSPGWNGFQTVFDFNSIPTSAIESLEVLKDGASAIYGSDAVAGVVNINLRKDFQGLNTQLSFGNTLDTDSFEKGAFIIMGSTAGKTSIITSFDWTERNAIYARDLPYTSTGDGTAVGGFDQRSSANVIANVRGLSDRVRFPSGQATFATPQTNPTLANAIAGNRFYNFQEDAGMFPETKNWGFYMHGEHELTDLITGFAEVSFRRSEVRIDAAPAPLFALNENGDSPFGTVVLPSTNPFNPFGEDIVDLRWRIRDAGNRINDVVSDVPRALLGLKGEIPNSSWTWETGALYTKTNTTNTNAGTVVDRLVQDAFNGIEIEGVTLYANPFGPTDRRVLDYFTTENPQQDSYEVRSWDISASGEVFQLPAGPMQMAVGGEYRTEELANIGTSLNETGQVVGGSEGANTFGSRVVKAAYAELDFPVIRGVEVQVAGRFEDYSDFGTTTKPKIAAKWKPLPELLLRASYGESFLAPNLPFLYTTQSTSFTSQFIQDPLRPNDPRQQIKQLGGGNPALQPEETSVKYAGFVYQPFSRSQNRSLTGLSFGVDYFKFDQENLIDSLSASTILGNLATYGHLVRRSPPAPGESVGVIESVITTFQNLANAEWEGFDYNINYDLRTARLGSFRANLAASQTVHYSYDGFDYAGTYNYPKWRGSATVAWNWRDWAASVFVSYIGEYEQLYTEGSINEQWLVNPQISYKGAFDTEVTIGMRNVFDKAPPIDQSDTTLTNPAMNPIEPAFWYVRISRDF